MVLGAAYHRADRTEDAERAFFDARAYLWLTRNAELQAELEYYEGAFAWTARELETAARHARGALAAKSVSLKCRALELLGAIAASSGDYTGQADFLEQALTRLEASERRDVWVEGHILYNLAILAREMHLTHVVDRLTARAESMPWSDETAALRVETLRHLGCCRARLAIISLRFACCVKAAKSRPRFRGESSHFSIAEACARDGREVICRRSVARRRTPRGGLRLERLERR